MEYDFMLEAISALYHSEWRLYSNCYKQNVFDLEQGDEALARAVCENCPVKTECLDDAMYFGDEGVRGGLSDGQRISLALHRKRYNAYFMKDIDIEGTMQQLQEVRGSR